MRLVRILVKKEKEQADEESRRGRFGKHGNRFG